MDDLLVKVVLGEIKGKNKAIHAYDSIVWKIRSGFLVFMFGGWSILLKVGLRKEGLEIISQPLALGLLLFSVSFAYGAWNIDRHYLRRKFRVILALNGLTEEIKACEGDYSRISVEFRQ
jgi:hypothetical protein